MKQKLLNSFKLRVCLLVAVLCAGFTSAWGETVSYTATSADKPTAKNGTQTGTVTGTNSISWSYSVTQSTKSGKSPYVAYIENSGWQLGSSNSPCTAFSISTSGISGTITKIEVQSGSYNASSSINVTVGGNPFGTQSQTTGSGENVNTLTFEGNASGNIVVSATASTRAFYFKSVTVTYTTSGSSLTASDLAITGAPVALNFDLYNNSSPQTVGFTTSSTGAVTVSGGDNYVTTSVSGKTITVTPTAVTPSAQTITISQAADDTYAAGSATFTVEVANSDPNVPGTQNNPYTVAQAIANTPSSGNVYIHGIVSAFYNTSIVGDGSNYRYYISDDGTTGTQLLVYKGKGLNNEAFDSADDLLVGDEVTICGSLITYQNASEVASGNYLVSWNRPVAAVEAPTFSPAAGTYASAQNVTLTCGTQGATIYYTIDGTTPTSSSTEYTSAISVSTPTTIKAIAIKGNDESSVATATYHFCSAQNPYTVTQALAFNEYPANGIYVTGIVSTAPTAAPSSGALTYYISVDGTTNDQLEVYKGKDLNNESFTAQDDIQVGDQVTIYGNVKIHNGTTEFDSGNYLVAHTKVPVINAVDVDIDYDATSGEIPYSIDNVSIGTHLTSATTAADWVSNIVIGDSEVTFECTANNGDTDRTATFTLTYTGAESKTITVTQKHYVEMYNGTGTFIKVTSVNDLEDGGYYVLTYDSHALKASYYGSTTNEMASASVTVNANDEITDPTTDIVWKLEANGGNWNLYNEMAGKYCNITANSTTGFSLSETATAYVASVSNDVFTFATTATGSRCIAYYSSNSSFRSYASNNAGASLTLYKLGQASSTPSITVNPATVDVDATATDPQIGIGGTLDISYANLTVSDMTDFYVQFYDAESNEISQPTWIEDVLVAEQDPQVGEGYVVSYTIEDNDGDARTAYFKVYVGQTYSNLVTVTQAAYVAPFQSTTWTLATSITSGKHYIIVNSDKDKAMGYDKGNNRDAVSVSLENDVITVNSADVYEFVIYGPDADGYYTIYDAKTPGYLYAPGGNSNNYLKTSTDIAAHSHWTIDFDSNNDNVASVVANVSGRNTMKYNSGSTIFSCYASGQSDIYLFEKDGEATPTETKTVNAKGYATYCSQNALDFANATGGTAWAITEANSSTGVITFNQIAGAARAGTGMLLMGSGTITMPSASGSVSAITNLLEGTTADKDVVADEYYGLSGDQFVKVNAGTVPAGKALLPASAVGNVKSFTFIFEGADGIKTVEKVSAEQAAEIFNLAGQRLQKAQRGVNIINGKKVLVK